MHLICRIFGAWMFAFKSGFQFLLVSTALMAPDFIFAQNIPQVSPNFAEAEYSANRQVQVLASGADKAEVVEINTLEQGVNHLLNYQASSSQGFQSSPDGKHFAVIANTDVFLIVLKGNYRRLTNTPGEGRDIAFSALSSC
jgi:hypothetical protein